MPSLHIVQGGIENGDKAWLERAAGIRLRSVPWMVPKGAGIRDEVVIFVPGQGFFATAQVTSRPKPKTDWANRYGAPLSSVRLIRPPISIGTIQRRLPKLAWANTRAASPRRHEP